MKYDQKKIGARIRQCRKEYRNADVNNGKPPDQASFAAEVLFCNRKTLSSWETGRTLPPLDMMLKMCDVFGCELGYLLCEYDTKTRAAADMQEETGLSEAAINELRLAHQHADDSPRNKKTELIDRFITACDPIAEHLTDLIHEKEIQFLFHAARSHAVRSLSYKRELTIFNRIYESDAPEDEKPLLYINEILENVTHGYYGNELDETFEDNLSSMRSFTVHYYQEYERLSEEREQNKTSMHRFNMNLVFNQIIDAIIDGQKPIILTSEEEHELERQGSDHGEHEKK